MFLSPPPIDRESIYRAVTGLNWIVLSTKHFVLETRAYDIHDLNKYEEILKFIVEASKVLNTGFDTLDNGDYPKVTKMAEQARVYYDEIVNTYVLDMAALAQENDYKKLFNYKEILSQLREIGKRIYITVNTLQDVVVKMD